MIALRQIRKAYGPTVAVDHVSFEVPDGLVTGLLGPNGAGKTTAIRSMTGLVHLDSGRVEVDGVDVDTEPLRVRARIGVVPESVGVYDHLTVREHVAYSARLHRLPEGDIAARIPILLAQLGLEALGNRCAGTLSMGERRRLALARALIHRPSNLIFDEPTNGLDVMGARDVRRAIRQLASEGRAVLVSSHVMPEVANLCDRIVVLRRGTVVATGTPDALLQATGCRTLEDAFVSVIGSDEGLN